MRWAGAALLFVAIQLCVAATLALSVGFMGPPPFAKYALIALIPVCFYAGGFALWNLRARPDRPLKHLRSLDWLPLGKFAGAMGLVWLQFVALTWMKAMIPATGPMWADPMLADLELSLLGADAWTLLPPPHRLIEILYLLWPLAVCGSFTALYFFQSERRDRILLAFFLIVGLLGTFGQYLLPSGGPVFYERLGYGERFAAMEIPSRTATLTSYLWAAYQGQAMDFATGISAFPSIHVATTTWMALSFRNWAAYAYLGVIFFGSIMLGWHYALDGVAGAAGAVACYFLAARLLEFRRPSADLAGETA